jgi:hypothetical protein
MENRFYKMKGRLHRAKIALAMTNYRYFGQRSPLMLWYISNFYKTRGRLLRFANSIRSPEISGDDRKDK